MLTSILQTAKQQGKNQFDVVVKLLCGRDQHKVLDIVPPPRVTLQDSSPDPPPRLGVPALLPAQPWTDLALPA